MNVNVIFHPDASEDYLNSFKYDEEINKSLARSFNEEIDKAIHRIINSPKHFPVVRAEIRRCLVAKFPFSVLFYFDNNIVYVMAIAHLKRAPNYWFKRISD